MPQHRGVTTRPHRKPDGGRETSDVTSWEVGPRPCLPKGWGRREGGGVQSVTRLASHPDAASLDSATEGHEHHSNKVGVGGSEG